MTEQSFLHFAFSEEQEMIRDTAERFLAENCKEELVRNILETEQGYAADLWRELGSLGLLGVQISEEHSGSGLGPVEQCLLAEELGKVLAPLPTVSTLYLAVELIKSAGTAEQQSRLLPAIASGDMVVAIAQTDAPNSETLVKNESLTGQKSPVADALAANYAIVVACGSSDTARSLYLVDLEDHGVTRTALNAIDNSRPFGRIAFENCPAEQIGELGKADEILQSASTRAAVYCAFEQVGGAQKALDRAADYAKERHAFGRPIGSFQAVKQLLADMFVSLALARANARYACWALLNNDPSLDVAAARAHLSATRAFRHCSSDTIQVHGGAGFMWETSPHLFYRRSEMLARSLGGPRYWEKALVTNMQARGQ